MLSRKRILLVYPQPAERKQWRFGFSLTLLYVGAILKGAGWQVFYLDFSIEHFEASSFLAAVADCVAMVVELDSFPLKRSLNIAHGEEIIKLARLQDPQVKIVACGHDCILNPRSVPMADFTICTEPEVAIEGVLSALMEGQAPIVTSHESLGDLDWLPFPERGLLSARAEAGGSIRHAPHLAKSTLIQTSRGCQNSCRFCQRQGWSTRFRAHSVGYSFQEFRHLHEQNYMNVWVADDNFTFRLERAKSLLRRIGSEITGKSWRLALSSWLNVDRETIDLCKAAGVSIISFGVESANQQILAFYGKRVDLEHAADIISYANHVGIFSVGNFIIGAPMETASTIQESIDLAKRLPFDQVNVKLLDYMVGSALYAELPENMRKGNRHVFASREAGVCPFPAEELRAHAREFQRAVTAAHSGRLRDKIRMHGAPYVVLPAVRS